jgi:acyl-CoA thioesterase I
MHLLPLRVSGLAQKTVLLLVLAGVVGGVLAGTGIAQFQSLMPTKAVRIMPIGDSITQGDKDYNSYRRSLWLQLRQAGYNVDFVGSMYQNFPDVPAPKQDFDQNHEGHWGWRTDEILKHIDKWANLAQPDIVLIHLGGNDLGQKQSHKSTIKELQALITRIRRVNRRN